MNNHKRNPIILLAIPAVSLILLAGCGSTPPTPPARQTDLSPSQQKTSMMSPAPQDLPEPKQVKEIVTPLRSLSEAEVSQLVQKIATNIAPFNIDELRSGLQASAPPAHPEIASHSGRQWTTERKRLEGTIQLTVLAIVKLDPNDKLQSVGIYLRRGGFNISELMSNEFGKTVAIFTRPTVEQSNQIGFSEVVLDEDGVFTQYRQTEGGKWTAESFRVVVK